ncbi:MAG: hypothetical protein ABIG71_03370 [Candidatus Uhrbacteria bacterium]
MPIRQARDMDKRQPNNSAKLQERFPDEYKKFFSEHDIVVSIPSLGWLDNGWSWRIGGPSIHLKLPFRVYVGLSVKPKGRKIELGSARVYDIVTDSFTDAENDFFDEKKTARFFKEAVPTFGTKLSGYVVGVLFERSENTGYQCSFYGALIALLALHVGTLSPEDLVALASVHGGDIRSRDDKASRALTFLQTMAWKYFSFSWHDMTIGSASFASFIDSQNPTVYFVEERRGSVENPYSGFAPMQIGERVEAIDSMRWWGYRFEELFGGATDFPLDVMSVYPGTPRAVNVMVPFIKETIIPGFDELQGFIQKSFASVIGDNAERLPPFLRNINMQGEYFQTQAKGQVIQNMAFLQRIASLYRHNMSSKAMTDFFDAVNGGRYEGMPFEEPASQHMERIIRRIQKRADEKHIQIGIHPLTFAWLESSMLIFAPPQQFRSEIEALTEELRAEVNPNIRLDFCSWRDGWNAAGIRLEQNAVSGTSPSFMRGVRWRLRTWTASDGLRSKFVNELDDIASMHDIVLNRVTGKVFIGGAPVTSKDLPSQKTAIDIIAKLLEDPARTLKNSELPSSSYASYRNELQGKIVGPFVKLVRDRIGKELQMRISGDLTRFSVSIDPTGFDIVVLERSQ